MSSADTAAPAEAGQEEPVSPLDERRLALLEALRSDLGDALVAHHHLPGHELTVRVTRESWLETGRVLRERHRMAFFDFLSAIDWLPSPYGRELDAEVDHIVHGAPERTPEPMTHGTTGGDTRFQVFMRVVDVRPHTGVIVKVDVPDDDLRIDSLVRVWAGADWHERETHEMFGIVFEGHPGLRNLYLPGDFEGYPLRKDFPLLARRVKPWPGIVDVEPMPGEEADEEGDE